MDTRSITIPLDEVWEIVNKPHRLISYIRKEVEKIPTYDGFSKETKEEVVERLRNVGESGVLHKMANFSSYTVYCNDRQDFIKGALLRMHKGKMQAFTQEYNFRTRSVHFTYYNNATIHFL